MSMLYCSRDMALDECNCYFSFWVIFSPFTPQTTQKIKMKKKKSPKVSSFYTRVSKIIIWYIYCSWGMVHDGFNCYFSFWAIFCPFTPLTALKMKISKNGKIGYQKLLLHDAWFLRYVYMVHDRRMGRQKKWHIKVGAPPKNDICWCIKADVKQQEIKELVVESFNFYKKYLQNWKCNVNNPWNSCHQLSTWLLTWSL